MQNRMVETTQQLKDIYSALATKEAKIIQYDKDIESLKRLIINNMKMLKRMREHRDNTMKEIKQLRSGLQLIEDNR